MQQKYHSNAKTNHHIRSNIQSSSLRNKELSMQYNVHINTVSKWKNRKSTKDKSSRPNTIHYSLTELEKSLIQSVRRSTWMPLEDVVEIVGSCIPKANKSNVYRTFKECNINQVPEEKREEAKKFKEYDPGYLHIDVTYLPKFDQKYYLFVAIDRATRLIYYKVYEDKSANSSVDFLKACKAFFPFYITHILTDNGTEFTDKFIGNKKEVSGNHRFDQECKKNAIHHRLIAPYTPKTNGMVERVNGTIKGSTIKVEKYESIDQLNKDLKQFLLFYNFTRRHGSLLKELNVKTPFQALEKWFQMKPEIFRYSPNHFQENAFSIKNITS